MKTTTIFLLTLFTVVAHAQQFYKRYDLIKMGKHVNTHYHEAAPIISPDGNTLYFFVDNHPENTYGKEGSQDIWVSRKNANGEWSAAEHLRSPFNQHRSNQVFTVMEDGTLFIKGGRSKNSKGFSLVPPDGRSVELTVKDFDKMNKGRFYGASMSADRKHMIIYFSEVSGGTASDLYVSHAEADGSWSTPKKLHLSHSLDDFGPFISPDQSTMYYASARPGEGRQGGIDLYQTKRLDNSWEKWSEPINLGRPINTAAMDAYFSMDKSGHVFTSRANSRVDGGNLDLFMMVPKTIKITLVASVLNQKTFEPLVADLEIKMKDIETAKHKTNAQGKVEVRIPEVTGYTLAAKAPGFLPKEESFKLPEIMNDTTLYVEVMLTPAAKKLMLVGNVYDVKTEKLITKASIEMTMRGDKKVNNKFPATGGSYQREIPKLGMYILTASAEGYINGTDSISVDNAEVSPFTRDLYLQPIEIGVTVRLKNIYFDFDKTTLKSQSFVELNKVVDFLKQNGSVEIEIAGHTDDKGSDVYNNNLSQGRSQAVVDYLISQGIESYRLNARGYGESKPIESNDTEEGRANNRRVEFTVLKK